MSKIEQIGEEIIEQIKENKCYLVLIKPDFLKELKKERDVIVNNVIVNNVDDDVETFAGIEIIETEFIENDWEILEFENQLEKLQFRVFNFI